MLAARLRGPVAAGPEGVDAFFTRKGFTYFAVKAVVSFSTFLIIWAVTAILPPAAFYVAILPALVFGVDAAEAIWRRAATPFAALGKALGTITFALGILAVFYKKIDAQGPPRLLKSLSSQHRHDRRPPPEPGKENWGYHDEGGEPGVAPH